MSPPLVSIAYVISRERFVWATISGRLAAPPAGLLFPAPEAPVSGLGGALAAAALSAVMPLITRHVVDTVVADKGAVQSPILGLRCCCCSRSRRRFAAVPASLSRRLALPECPYDLRNDLLGALQRLDGPGSRRSTPARSSAGRSPT